MAIDDILPLVGRLISGVDYSHEAATRLRDLLAENFVEDSYVQQLVVALGNYRPGGGDGHSDYPEMRERLTATRSCLAGAF